MPWYMSNMPDVDILDFIDKISEAWPKFLFAYFPIITCVLMAVYFLDFVRAGAMINRNAASGRFYKGTIIGYTVNFGEFKENGKIPCIMYPVVRYKKRGQYYQCMGDTPSFKKKNEQLSVRVCPDGEARRASAGFIVSLIGIVGVIASIITAITIFSATKFLIDM